MPGRDKHRNKENALAVTGGKTKKMWAIKSRGVHVMFGHVAQQYKTERLAKILVEEGMYNFHPPKRSSHGQFFQETLRVWSVMQEKQPDLSVPRPKAMVGTTGTWASFGPIEGKKLRLIENAGLWTTILQHLDSSYPTGSLVRVDAVVHNNRTRDVLDAFQCSPDDNCGGSFVE
jgi:hypothetical protein